MANLRVDKITSTETFERTGSVQFDGSGDYLSLGTSSTFNYLHDRTEPYWTIEGWIYFKESGSYDALFGNNSGTAQVGVYLGKDTSDRLVFSINKGTTGVTALTLTSTETFSSGKWYHIAVTNNNYLINTFINGVNINSGYWGSASTNDANTTLNIGRLGTSTVWDHNGHISNLRILKGQALYTKNFKPPMRELEVIPGTVLLACQSKTDASLEKTGKTITVNGNAVANELTPGILTDVVKSGGSSAIKGSVEFDGNGDYLSVPSSNNDFYFEDHKFTIECWTYTGLDTTSNHSLLAQWGSGTDRNIQFDYRGDASKVWRFYYRTSAASAELVNSTSVIEPNSWYHLAVVADGTNLKLFVNGVLEDTNAIAGDAQNSTVNLYIGSYQGTLQYYKGYISNLRIVKGTALYTGDFIPPTRELKKVPGTVLLCCQDPDNPLTEATGKTITPYGDLGDGSLGGELVTNNSVWTLAKGGSGATDWTVSNQGRSLAGTTVTSGYIRATYTVPKGDYLVSFRWTGGAFAAQSSAGYVVATDGTSTEFGSSDDGTYSVYMSDTTYVRFTGTSWNTAYTVDDISIKRIYKNNGASNFTPQVGDDRQITFEGVTKINTDAYFYLPTGDTASREATGNYNAGTRGLFGGTFNISFTRTNIIGYITIASTGNAIDFGDLSVIHVVTSSLSSRTRGLWAGGAGSDGSRTNTIDYVTITTTGNALDFGDLSYVNYYSQACSSSTRGIISGGNVASFTSTDNIDYITTASKGNANDFGNLNTSKDKSAGINSPTRGIFAGGQSNAERINSIEYITIATTGNGSDFGDLTKFRSFTKGVSSVIRGLIIGGQQNMPTNIIDYVTIATTGNAIDFGDITFTTSSETSAVSSLIRGVTGGGAYNNSLEYVQIPTTGNALDFGDLTVSGSNYNGGCSNGHGGLG